VHGLRRPVVVAVISWWGRSVLIAKVKSAHNGAC
jgi:hypothetical protein